MPLSKWWNSLSTTTKKSIATLVRSICAVLITNFADPKDMIFSWTWFRHVWIAIFVLTIFNEARYWQSWSDKVLVNSNGEKK